MQVKGWAQAHVRRKKYNIKPDTVSVAKLGSLLPWASVPHGHHLFVCWQTSGLFLFPTYSEQSSNESGWACISIAENKVCQESGIHGSHASFNFSSPATMEMPVLWSPPLLPLPSLEQNVLGVSGPSIYPEGSQHCARGCDGFNPQLSDLGMPFCFPLIYRGQGSLSGIAFNKLLSSLGEGSCDL